MFSPCDYVQDVNGKMIIINPFDHYQIPQLPITLPSICVVARIRIRPSDGNSMSIGINILDPEGNSTLQEPAEMIANYQVPPGSESNAFNIPAFLLNVSLKSYGRYSVILTVKGQEMRNLPLFVTKPVEN